MTGIPSVKFAAIRPDLELIESTREPGGSPTWVLHDPFGSRYLRVGWLEYELIKRWSLGNSDAIIRSIRNETTLDATVDDVANMDQFLRTSGMLRLNTAEGAEVPRRARWWRSAGSWRFPLLAPNRVLDATAAIPRAVWTLPAMAVAFCLLIFCLVQINRESAWFFVSLSGLFDPAMIPSMLLVVIFAKVVHEFGHAWACRLQGLDVPTMGVAVFFLWPFLYTDTTAAWRLRDRRRRALVASAGVIAELLLGLVALTIWCFLSDGMLRQSALFLATFSIGATLLVNANPFMKWDGYYVVSDLTGMENLQPRAFAFGRWALRNAVLGQRAAPPEPMGQRATIWLVAYSVGAWAYRFFLFAGLAVLLYSTFFKAIGILLFAFVLFQYIVRPLVNEFRELLRDRASFQWNRFNRIGAGIFAILMLLLLLPVDRGITLPAVLRSASAVELHAAAAGRVLDVAVERGSKVLAGSTLVALSSPALEEERVISRLDLQQATYVLDRVEGAANLENREVIFRQQERRRSMVARNQQRLQELTLVAPINGEVTWLAQHLKADQWVADKAPLVRITNPERHEVIAYVGDANFDRLASGSDAVFIPDDLTRPRVDLVLVRIDEAVLAQVDEAALELANGGNVPVIDGRVHGNWFALSFEPGIDASPLAIGRELPGRVVVDAAGDWLLGPAFRRLHHLFVRESSQ